jgi:hypothetical protein
MTRHASRRFSRSRRQRRSRAPPEPVCGPGWTPPRETYLMDFALLLLAAAIGIALGEGMRRRRANNDPNHTDHTDRTQAPTGDGSRRLP